MEYADRKYGRCDEAFKSYGKACINAMKTELRNYDSYNAQSESVAAGTVEHSALRDKARKALAKAGRTQRALNKKIKEIKR